MKVGELTDVLDLSTIDIVFIDTMPITNLKTYSDKNIKKISIKNSVCELYPSDIVYIDDDITDITDKIMVPRNSLNIRNELHIKTK